MPSKSPLIEFTATEQLELLKRGDISAVELTQAYLDSIASRDAKVGAFLRVENERALAQAASVDERRQQKKPLGKLAGIPVAVKDVLCDRSTLTTCASRMLENFRPPYDSTVVAKLKAADAVLLGRTNMDEFAMGGSTENSAFQLTRNPWDLERTPGGSSGGAAACVAADMAPLSIGTDTGGSIRQPAGLCGVVGLKPTYGRVSRFGLVAFASSLDQVGPLARTTQDAAILLETIAGHDPHDSTSLDQQVPALLANRCQAASRAANRSGPGAFCRGTRRRGRIGSPRGNPGLRITGGHRQRGLPAAQQTCGGHLLRDCSLRGLEQSGSLRRRPLRPSHGRNCNAGGTRRRAQSIGGRQRRDGALLDWIPLWCGCTANRGARVSARK